jgi:hypothetical protein
MLKSIKIVATRHIIQSSTNTSRPKTSIFILKYVKLTHEAYAPPSLTSARDGSGQF